MRKRQEIITYKSIKTKLYLDNKESKFLLYLMDEAKKQYKQALYNVRQHYNESDQYLKLSVVS